MKNAEEMRQLLHAMNDFAAGYSVLKLAIEEYEQKTGKSVNDLPGFTESYPFIKSFDELAINEWLTDTVEGIKRTAYRVLNYEYLNTGGNTMVGIAEVWLPAEMKTIYAYVNEEGCTLSLVDFIRNDLIIDDYDEVTFEVVDWGRITGHEKYFELYRDVYNRYLVDDCKYFGTTYGVSYHLLSDELQRQVSDDYREWCDTENGCLIDTDGKCIVVSPSYEPADTWDKMLAVVKEFKHWHDTTAGVERLYDENYKLEFAGHKIELPYTADVWDAVDTMLERTINDW